VKNPYKGTSIKPSRNWKDFNIYGSVLNVRHSWHKVKKTAVNFAWGSKVNAPSVSGFAVVEKSLQRIIDMGK
jgi:hypothetical protein